MTHRRLLLGAGALLVFIGLSSFDVRGSADQGGYLTVPSQQPPVRDRVPPPQVGRGQVRGRVVDGQTGRAISRARVRLQGGGQPGTRPAVLSDDQGTFTFTALPIGAFTIIAEKSTYMPGSYPERGGSLRSGAGRPVVLQANQTIDNVVVKLYHGGAITGRVVDAHGDPIEFTQVSALALTPSGAGRAGMRGASQTNDIGEFRISRLPPGRYVLWASTQSRSPEPPGQESAPLPQPAPTYFPSVVSKSEAQPIPVARGQTVTGIEIGMLEGVPTVVTGRVISSDGQPLSPATGTAFVNARADDRELSGGTVGGTSLRPDGTFRFLLAPGNYILEAHGNRPAGPSAGGSREQYGMTKVAVAGETMDVSIVLGAGATASGRVVFEGETPPPNPPAQMGVPLSSSDGSGTCRAGMPKVAPDWTFTVEGLVGTCSAPTFGQFGRWMIKSIVINNQDLKGGSVVFEPGQHFANVQIVVTDRRNELNLLVTDEQGQPTREYAALVFPTDKSKWEGLPQVVRTYVPPPADLIASMQAVATASGRGNLPAQASREVVSGLMGGEYYAIALDDIESEAARDPAVLERLSTVATRVTLSEGAIDVNLPRVRLNDVIR